MKLSRVNTVLLALIILINGVTIGLPFLPSLLFGAEAAGGREQQALAEKINRPALQIPGPNRLIMPSILFDQEIHEGAQAATLRQGVWRRPQSGTPDSGNTVLVAHRFTYRNPRGAFYHLDKLQPGDTIALVWNHSLRRYRIQETKIVGPHDTYIENASARPQLTLYTCTPLQWPKNRLVVIATPLKEHSND